MFIHSIILIVQISDVFLPQVSFFIFLGQTIFFAVGYYYSALSNAAYVASNCRLTDDWQSGKDLEGSNFGLIKLLCWHLPGGTKTSVRIASVPAGIQTKDIQNIRLGCYH
jgi:hypothetical protein